MGGNFTCGRARPIDLVIVPTPLVGGGGGGLGFFVQSILADSKKIFFIFVFLEELSRIEILCEHAIFVNF